MTKEMCVNSIGISNIHLDINTIGVNSYPTYTICTCRLLLVNTLGISIEKVSATHNQTIDDDTIAIEMASVNSNTHDFPP